MANRRLVNLVMTDIKNRMFSLHRMDLSKLLFYPSTVEAEAAAGRVVKRKPAKMGKLQLPPPTMGFEPYPTRHRPSYFGGECTMFVLLHGPHGCSSGEASRILFAGSEGQATMYDVDSRSVISVPDLMPERVARRDDMPKAIVTGAGTGEERLYVFRSDGQLEVLDFSGGEKSRSTYSTNWSRTLLWQSLPPLPVADPNISSFTVVDSDRIICVSAGSYSGYEHGSGTFCFDTVSQEWWKAGDWHLPFNGRAEYVPELNTWLGFSSIYPHHYFCAADLCGVAMAPRQAPTLQHVWEDFELPPMEKTSEAVLGVSVTRSVYWKIPQLFLVNLGSGRFCIAKVALGKEFVSGSWTVDSHEGPEDMFTVLTGVEVIRGGEDGELRMVKHKSRELVHPGLEVACVL